MKLIPSQTFLIFKSYLISLVHLCLDIANVRNVNSILGATDVMLFTHLLDYFGGFLYTSSSTHQYVTGTVSAFNASSFCP